MIKQVFTFTVSCDRCSSSADVRTDKSVSPALPEGWTQEQFGPETFDFCPACGTRLGENRKGVDGPERFPITCFKLGCDPKNSNLRCTRLKDHAGPGDAWSSDSEDAAVVWKKRAAERRGEE